MSPTPTLPRTPSDFNKLKILSTRENLTYVKDNIVQFISSDLSFSSTNNKLLEDINAVKREELKEAQPTVGDVITVENRNRYIFNLVINNNATEEITPSALHACLRSLAKALSDKEVKSFRISRKGELTDKLPRGKLLEIILVELRHLPVTVTVCFGACSYLPVEDRKAKLLECHTSMFGGHRGVIKTYRRIREQYYWEGMRSDIENYIRRCRVCQEQKLVRVKSKEPMIITDTPTEVFSKIAIDTVGPLPTTTLGNKHILTMQCQLSKFCIAVPIPNTQAITIADALARYLIAAYGRPKIILSDNSRSFVNKILKELSEIFGFRLALTTAYHPQSNGSLERSHSMLNSFLRTKATDKTDWDKIVPFAMYEYNTSVHSATGFTPFEVVFGRQARSLNPLPDEFELETYSSYICDLMRCLREIQETARNNLIQAKIKSKTQYDKKARPQELQVGMLVYVLKEPRKGKLDRYYNGVFEIKEIRDNNNVILESETGKILTKHLDKVKRCYR